MIFQPLRLKGAFVVEPEPVVDERGFFARTWCRREFEAQGLHADLAQCSVSFNARRGTLRGLHYQAEPHAEVKLVRCTRGAIWDVLVDLRPDSPTFKEHAAVVLDETNRRMVYVPEGVAHGFLTLADATEVFYQISAFHHPASARGVRWDDPAFAIPWPEPVRVISERDRTFPDFDGGRRP
ncbi:MAG TPA: dTDP-4-dehydrorhamnose 3,5-epimerase [Candidatus Binatia bacterium]|nr:dTDP-4-dehydrorhamnose 3,5-epimerase [Candidatus Binatia bacterium]